MARSHSTSRKRSAASSSRRKPPEPLVFFIDRSLGRKKVPEALGAAGLNIRVHDELFPQATQDVVWLDARNKLGWTPLMIAEGGQYGATVKEFPEAAALVRKLMTERGMDPEQYSKAGAKRMAAGRN